MQLTCASRAVEDTAQRIRSLPGGVNWIDECIDVLKEAVGAETAIAFQLNSAHRSICGARYRHHDVFGETFWSYSDRYILHDPLVERAAKAQLGKFRRQSNDVFYRLSDYAGTSFYSSEYYIEFLKALDIYNKIAFSFSPACTPDRVFVFGFHRPRVLSDFGEKELLLLRHLMPALKQKVDYAAFELISTENSAAIAALEAGSSGPIVLFDDFGCVVFLSKKARQMFPFLDGETQEIQSLRAIIRSSSKAAETGESTFRHAVTFQGETFTLKSFNHSGGRRLFLLTGGTSDEAELTSRISSFGISTREAEVVKALAGGCSNIEIARDLRISTRTVENHIRSIYVKVGAHSRTQLIQKVFLAKSLTPEDAKPARPF